MTQADLTLAIAIGGLSVAVLSLIVAGVSLFLTVRRDRAAGRVGVRMVVEAGPSRDQDAAPELRLTLSNPERRTVTVQRAGLSLARWRTRREEFKGWDLIPAPQIDGHFAGMLSPFHGGLLFEPGDPAETVRAPLYRVRAACFPNVARWVWCEDSIGGVHWERIPKSVQAAIASTKRHKLVLRPGGLGSRLSVEAEDAEAVNPGDLDIDPFSP